MKNLSKTKDELKSLIASKGPGIVLKSLNKILPSTSPKYNTLVALQNDFTNYKANKLRGTLTHESDMVQLAQLRSRVIDLIDSLEDEDFDKTTRRSHLSSDQKIRKGHVLYRIPAEMKLNKEARCLVRIAFDQATILEDLDLDDEDLALKSNLRISDYMRVEIKDPRAEPVFEIRSTSKEVQFIDVDDFTEWRFYVKPLQAGEHTLELKVSVIQRINGEDHVREKTLDESVVIITEESAVVEESLAWKRDAEALVVPCAVDTITLSRMRRGGGLRAAALSLALLIGLTSVTYAAVPAVQQQIDWRIARHLQDSEAGYDAFITKYKKPELESPKVEEATYRRVKAIEKEHKNDKEKIEEALTVYIDEYGENGDYATNAFWELAVLSELPEDYQNYIALPGTQEYEAEAKKEVATLETKVWAEVQQNKTALNLDRYLRIYPQGSQRTTAIELLADTNVWVNTAPLTMPKRMAIDTQGLEKRLLVYAEEAPKGEMKQVLLERSEKITIAKQQQNKKEPLNTTTETETKKPVEETTTTASPCPDKDKDGICDNKDNCPDTSNADQKNTDNDGLGDSCDQCKTEMGPTNNNGCPIEERRVSFIAPNMVSIQGGTFQMGDVMEDYEREGENVHTVTLSNYKIGRYEVTFEEYDAYCEAKKDAKKPDDEGWGRGSRPVINVNWYDAVNYCNWLSTQEGYTLAYTINGENVSRNKNANGYRLPTEAEWEYAARQRGETVRFGNGEDVLDPDKVNFDCSENYKKSYSIVGKYRRQTVKVGSLNSPNSLGLHDMSGNVSEWCWDKYTLYPSTATTNPIGGNSGYHRLTRGGYWSSPPVVCRATDRTEPWGGSFRGSFIGFRLARS